MVEQELVRVVATADNHLNRFYDRMVPEKLKNRRSYLRAGFKAAVDYAIAWPAHLFLIAGDLFDQPDPRNVDRAFVANCLAHLRDAGVKVYAIGGNHDTPKQSTEQGGITPQEIYSYLGGLTLFDTNTEISTDMVEVGGLRVAVGGMSPDPSARGGSDPLEGVTWDSRPANADFGIILLHGQVEGYELPDKREPVFAMRSLEGLEGADLFVVGDIHRPAMRRIGGGKRMLVIPGATERVTYGEDPGVPGFATIEMGHGGVFEYVRMPLAGQPRAELTVRATELDPDDPTGDLILRVMEVATNETMVKLRLEGLLSRERYHALEVRRLYEAVSPHLFQLTLDTDGLLIEDERHQVAERGVRFSQQEEIGNYENELLADAAGNTEEASLIREAVRRLLDRY